MSLVEDLHAAGLTGRGGAAFSTGVKVAAAHDHGAHLVVNACDGEVGAAKDAFVVEHHLAELVEGAHLVAPGRGRSIRFATHRGSRTAALLAAAGLDVLEIPGRYVSSEESALVSAAQGGLARPMTKRRPFVTGGRDAQGRRVPPTVVLNAETVWRIAQVATHGPAWFRSVGTDAEPGPRLVTLTGAVAWPGVLETRAGVPVADLLAAAAPQEGAEHVVVGGLGGALVPLRSLRALRWTGEDLATVGATIGPGVVDVLDPQRCPVRTVGGYLRYAAGETAGQCGPCMFGVPALAAAWDRLAADPGPAAVHEVRRHAGLLPDRGACRFPDGVSHFAASALRALGPHLDAHAAGTCPAHERSTRAHHA
ncbi:NADH-ubiquinone oxidoreductase-F iron-sulfur binding region domain-containing protein [Arthrobacter sp. NEB 688]|uniref:NADH-ubiquinone oxidoreductase-F iron-sulfur binding region domain-containing protein n=1 Tax=Arthrobacter sp. NEB 688 TaxID=904039 RepID=UPI00156443A1|nr:NADH-ubiquinone oxidoreductase-F iron-sulfur binding region domain-containing protein [Arthrobacter sp. NEB 688]QKE83381.1 formate dehydrogenase [Arthrobacter sp. NEB 688]